MLACLLVLLIGAAYLPVLRNGFVNFDDRQFVYENGHVQAGLSWSGITWAFRTFDGSFWQPLTWLSFMLDRQLFGPAPWGFHLTNLLLHAASAVLLFVGLQRMTEATWRSFFVAALFGLHPLHVESVAWIAERKDVLSAFFWMAAMLMYVRYTQEPRIQSSIARLWYILALAFFVCGLMSKTMVVTFPLVLLLLDAWPLARMQGSALQPKARTFLALLVEKVPFLVASLAFGVLTLHTQGATGALRTVADFPLGQRLQNAALASLQYCLQMVWPVGMAVYYPYPDVFPLWAVLLAGAWLLVVSVLAIALWRRRPYVPVGWSWYLITLLPVSGLIQMGAQSRADRYTYLPLIGIFLLVTWAASALTPLGRFRRPSLFLLATVIIGICMMSTRRQVLYWKDSESLFRHALATTGASDLTYNNLGAALLGQGKLPEAVEHLQQAVLLEPARTEARVNLGIALSRQGNLAEAATQLRSVLKLAPNTPLAHSGLGDVLTSQGELEQAIGHYQEALRLMPGDAATHHNLAVALTLTGRTNDALLELRAAAALAPEMAAARSKLGVALGKTGHLDEAIAELQAAVRLAPEDMEARCSLGDAFMAKRRIEDALSCFQQAARIAPADYGARQRLGVALGMLGRGTEAVVEFEAAVRLKPGDADARANLGATLLDQGRLEEAIAQLKEAVRINPRLASAQRDLGVALGKQGHLDGAVAHLTRSLELDPNSAEAHCNLGVALARGGQLETAISHFQKALSLKPEYADARGYLQKAVEIRKEPSTASP